MKDFDAKLEKFVAHVQSLVTENEIQMGIQFRQTRAFIHTVGRRYVKIATQNNQTCVYGFVDRTNGDILMSATWRAPAKHARGNVLDEKTWNCAGPYGIAYLRG